MVKIAVVMSVYKNDCKEYLTCAIESILAQTYQDFKLFIKVDGEIGEELKNALNYYHTHPKIYISYRDVNKGLASSLNELIDLVLNEQCYELIARMDSDDISLPERLDEQLKFMMNNPDIDVVGSYCHEFGSTFALNVKKVPLQHEQLLEYTIYKCPFIHPTVMFRTAIFESDIRYPTKTSLSEDLALWFTLLINGYQFANIDKVLLDYRLTSSTLSRRTGLSKAISEVKIRTNFAMQMHVLSLRSFSLIMARGLFALCPPMIKKVMYKKCR